MSDQGDEASKIVHDFNNILGLLMLYCERAIAGSDGMPEVRKDLEEIHKGISKAAGLNQKLRDLIKKS
jgi:hypothetical protein